MLLMKVSDETPAHNVSSRNPGSFLRTIALPVYEVLAAPSTSARADDAAHSIDESPVKEARGGWGWGWSSRYQRALADRLDFGHMECRVHPHRPRELEPDSHRADDLLDGEGPDKLGSQLVGFHTQREVTGGEPNLLTHLVLWSLRAPTVGC